MPRDAPFACYDREVVAAIAVAQAALCEGLQTHAAAHGHDLIVIGTAATS